MNKKVIEMIDRLAKHQNDNRFKHENHLSDIYELLIANDKEAMFVDYILDKQIDNNIIHVKALAHCELDESDIYEISLTNDGSSELGSVPDWDYHVDSFLLTDLEDGYQIKYMPLEIHAGHWYCIHELQEEIDNEKGLQLYLSYCQKHYITHELLSSVRKNTPDISDLYQEMNQNYKIVAEVRCFDQAVILGYNKYASQQYVTWITTPNRYGGYVQGHYYDNYENAFKDFNIRSHNMMDSQIRNRRVQSKQKKKHYEER